MLSRTRGVELLSIMKADTYSNILALVDDYHYLHGCDDTFGAAQESTMSNIRADLTHIMEVRALRLSDEASSLPPTHFLLLTSLSAVSSIAFVTASLAVVKDLNDPPEEARLLFAGLMALYILFFNFCRDLNGPFQGVYQIKRSNAVSHLLQTKWLIVNQLGNKINFGEFEEVPPDATPADEELSFLDRIKSFFSDTEHEQIAQVELDTMETLVNELQEHNERASEETTLVQTKENNYALAGEDNLSSTISDTEDLLDEIKQTIKSDLAQSEDMAYAPESTEPNGNASQHGLNGLRDDHKLGLDEQPNKAKETQPEESTGAGRQFDYASYFRSTSGFAS